MSVRTFHHQNSTSRQLRLLDMWVRTLPARIEFDETVYEPPPVLPCSFVEQPAGCSQESIRPKAPARWSGGADDGVPRYV